MPDFKCDNTYEIHLKEYNELVLGKYGISSKSAEREIICMSDRGNTVALTLYADMIFYKKLLRHKPYVDAFYLYMQAGGIKISEEGKWYSDGAAYPLSFWMLGYYLINYKREAFLLKCDTIPELEEMSIEDRFASALNLAATCLDYVKAPGAINLIGRIMRETAASPGLFEKLKDRLNEILGEHEFSDISEHINGADSVEDFNDIADDFFVEAALGGYVYACNNLALREADKIIELMKSGSDEAEPMKSESDEAELDEAINKYIEYLKIAADRYEPYAANRLGLFYRTGEIFGTTGKVTNRKYISNSIAKEYFQKATVYPDENSAWAYLNLLKYYNNDYDKDIDLMNEHMEYIRQLNPSVYDIAMEL